MDNILSIILMSLGIGAAYLVGHAEAKRAWQRVSRLETHVQRLSEQLFATRTSEVWGNPAPAIKAAMLNGLPGFRAPMQTQAPLEAPNPEVIATDREMLGAPPGVEVSS